MANVVLLSAALKLDVDPLAALRAVARRSAHDYVLLHTAAGTGPSVLGFDPLCRLVVSSRGQVDLQGPWVAAIRQDPLEALQQVVSEVVIAPAADGPAQHPMIGWLGFVSYEVGLAREAIAPAAPDELHWPLLYFALFRHYVLFDETGAWGCSLRTRDAPPGETDPWAMLREAPAGELAIPPALLLAGQSRESFGRKVRRTIDYIGAGDIYQANLAQRWTFETSAPPHAVFERLCQRSAAPFAACMRLNAGGTTRHVASASPELFLSVRHGRAVTRPIKGTRPRDPADAQHDARLRDELLASAKDRAELTMIVDLLRNDLGRVSTFGSVQVTQPRVLEAHPTVWHTVAQVESQLRPDAGLAAVLVAVCPGGSITGAPKIRAMQIIDELESAAGEAPFRRDLYCGNIGVITPPNALESAERAGRHCPQMVLNIAIRTLLLQEGRACAYAGGGIVADSDPGGEYEETLHKARAMLGALGAPMRG